MLFVQEKHGIYLKPDLEGNCSVHSGLCVRKHWRAVWAAMEGQMLCHLLSTYYAPGTAVNIQDVMGNRKGGSIFSGFRRQNQVQATTGQMVRSALESEGGEGEAGGLLLPAETQEEVGRG